MSSQFSSHLDDCKWKIENKKQNKPTEKGKNRWPKHLTCAPQLLLVDRVESEIENHHFYRSSADYNKNIRSIEESHCCWFGQWPLCTRHKRMNCLLLFDVYEIQYDNIRSNDGFSILWYCILYSDYYFVSQYHQKWLLYLYEAIFNVLPPDSWLVNLTRVQCPFPILSIPRNIHALKLRISMITAVIKRRT